MDKREGETSGLRSLSVSDSIDRRELFGGLDQNLEIIEKNLKVDIIQRGNELLLKGENSQKAENLLKEMMGVLEKGGKLDQQKINYIADLSNEGISYKQENVEKGIICFTHDGKPLRPKTLGQKIYVESIRNHDIVFGIGPAGTGKTYIAVAMAVNALKNKEVQKIILVMTLFGWTSVARIARGAVMEAKNLEFNTASTALGSTPIRNLFRHILPNSLAPIIVVGTTSLATYIVLEATLSFLGVGLPTTTVSWGGDISNAQSILRTDPMVLFYPSAALAITVLAFIMMGDAVKDALDPKSRTA